MASNWFEILVNLPAVADIGLRLTAVLAATWIVHAALLRGNPRWRVLLWRLTAIGLVVIPLLVTAMPKARFVVQPSRTPFGASPRSQWAALRTASAEYNTADAMTSAERPIPRVVAGLGDDPLAQPLVAVDEPGRSLAARGWLGWILWACWGLGAAILALHWATAQWRVRRILARCEAAPQSCLRALDQAKTRLGCSQPTGLRISREAGVPFVAGLLRAVIVLPARMAKPDSARELPAIFAHELAHGKSQDLAWMGLLHWVGILFWFHPLVWRISRAHSIACEEVADATAARLVGDASEYSGTLARAALFALAPPPPAATIPMARSPEIVTRLARLKRGLRFLPLARRSVVASAVLAAVVLPTVAGFELVLAGSSAVAADGTRTIEFPEDYSVGWLFFTCDEPQWQSRIGGIHYPASLTDVLNGPRRWNWGGHTEAQRTVTIPAGAKVKLLLDRDAGIRNMAWISRIGPDDLHTLETHQPQFGDAQLAQLARLTGLEELRLRNVPVSDQGLRGLEAMTALKVLWLEDAKLSNAGLKRVGQLKSLEALAIVGGSWDDAGLANLAHLSSLREFYYSPRQVRGPGLEHIARLPSLRYVYSSGPEFTDQHLAAWSRAKSLNGLHIALAKITDEGLTHIENLTELEYLTLSYSGTTGAGMVHLKPLTKLKQLHLNMPAQRGGASLLTVGGLAHLTGLQSLERLDLPPQGMTNAHCEQVSRLKNLKFLRIGESSDSPIGDAGLEHLAKLENLECLDIGGARITDRGFAHIASLSQLKHLHAVYVPRVTNRGFARLAALKSLQSLFMPFQSRVTLSALSQLNGLSNLRYVNCEPTKPPAPREKALDISGLTQLEILVLPAVRDKDLACLRNMKNLQELTLINPAVAAISDRGMAHLARVTSLKQLNIGGAALTDAGLAHLAGMQQLFNLIITGQFTDEAVAHLEKLKALKFLQIYDSKLSAAAKQRLKRNLPNLIVLDDSGRPMAQKCPVKPSAGGR